MMLLYGPYKLTIGHVSRDDERFTPNHWLSVGNSFIDQWFDEIVKHYFPMLKSSDDIWLTDELIMLIDEFFFYFINSSMVW